MKALINEHQLNQLIQNIVNNYKTFANQKKAGKFIFDKLEKPSSLALSSKRTVLSFKKILFPNNYDLINKTPSKPTALLGLANCDVHALGMLIKEMGESGLIPKREDLLIVASECEPDDNCFCDLMGIKSSGDFDLYIQEEYQKYFIWAKTPKGASLLKKNGIKPYHGTISSRISKIVRKPFDKEKIAQIIKDKEGTKDFFTGISNNCFGCGACSAVCPLCFCFRQSFNADTDGKPVQCLQWDSCFAKRFSEIQHNFDLRPTNYDRLYNWYHHKFVRAPEQSGHTLCTGCGRCITACTANLNVKNILNALLKSHE